MFLTISKVDSLRLFIITDEVNEVTHFELSTITEQGDFHDEIDIVKGELIDESFVLTLEAEPDRYDNSCNGFYDITITWSKLYIDFQWKYNRTFCDFGYGYNKIKTRFYNSTGHYLINEDSINVTIIVGNTIVYPIDYYSLIVDPSSPIEVKAWTKLFVFDNLSEGEPIPLDEWFNDSMFEYNIIPESTNLSIGFIFITSISVLIIITGKRSRN